MVETLQNQPVVQVSVFNEQSSKLQQQQVENINLRSELQHLQSELKVLKDNGRQSLRFSEEINRSKEHYEQQISSLKAGHVRELEQLSQTLEVQRNETDRLCVMIDELNKKLQQRDEEMERMRGEVQSASVKWYEMSAKSGRASREIEELDEKLEEREEEIEKLKGLKGRLESQLNLQADTIAMLEARLHDRELDSTVLVKEQIIAQQQNQLGQLELQLFTYKDAVADLNAQTADLRQHQERLQAELRQRTQELEHER